MQTIELPLVSANVPKCAHCNTRTDIQPVWHDNDCPCVPKCEHCNTRTDIPPICHSFNCPYTVKCQFCKCRLDYFGTHNPTCPTIKGCISCGIKVGQPHLDTCDPFVRFQIKITKTQLELTECPICSSDGTDCQTSCGHSFHKECLGKWLNCKQICPYCRGDVLELKLNLT